MKPAKSALQIRRATEADVELMRRLWADFNAEATFAPYPGVPFDASLITGHVALVAEKGNTPVGTVYANTGSAAFGYVFGLYIVPEARRRGIARALMLEVAAILRDEGKQYVVLSVDTPNASARALYNRLRFEDAARTLRIDIDRLLRDR